METKLLKKKRKFVVNNITISDCGILRLAPNEMICIVSSNGNSIEITAKNWGFYLGGSCNSRALRNGFKTAIVKNPSNKIFINAVERSKLSKFKTYLKQENSCVICWLDEWLKEN